MKGNTTEVYIDVNRKIAYSVLYLEKGNELNF